MSSAVVEQYQLAAAFECERQKLMAPYFADRATTPLAFWAAVGDRHLPLALMGRSIYELLETPFETLYATPGVGPKKMASLLRLLARVSDNDSSGHPSEPALTARAPTASPESQADGSLCVTISESLWAQWRACVQRHGLEHEMLGRLARSLRYVPRALWSTPLATYMTLTLSEVRGLRTHGEKRIGAVLEVFGNVASILLPVEEIPHLAVMICPRLIQQAENWVQRRLESHSGLTVEEVQVEFVAPLIQQLAIDSWEPLADVVRSRVERPNVTVGALARHSGLSRGRLYELCADATTIAAVRWPKGAALTSRLQRKLATSNTEPDVRRVFEVATSVWFPPQSGCSSCEDQTEADGGSIRASIMQADN